MKADLPFYKYLLYTLFQADTRPLRLALAIVNVFFSIYMIQQAGRDINFMQMFASIPWSRPEYIWGVAFLCHAYYLIIGLTGRYNFRTLMIEGVFGWGLWTWTAITHWVVQGGPGPTFACSLMMTWIVIRYPTHWTAWGDRDA